MLTYGLESRDSDDQSLHEERLWEYATNVIQLIDTMVASFESGTAPIMMDLGLESASTTT